MQGDSFQGGIVNYHPIRLIFATLAVALISGCATTSDDWHGDFVQSINEDGSNPYIRDPVMQDLEKRIRDITRAKLQIEPPFNSTFDPRNQAILNNFQSEYDHTTLLRDIDLARAGFPAAVAAYYPTMENQTDCRITDHSAHFRNLDTEPTRFTWQFVRGSCANGVAQGIAEAKAAESGARFVGRFEQGVMTEGIFTMLREDGTRVVQIGGIPSDARPARLLSSQLHTNGYQNYYYGDFNDQGQPDGFSMRLSKHTQSMVVQYVGHFSQGEMNGFAARQKQFDYKGGRFKAVWIGHYQNGLLNGAGAWTNGLDRLVVGQWKGGKQHGIGFEESVFHFGDYSHDFMAGRYVEGKKQGWFNVRTRGLIGDGTEYRDQYDNGRWVADDRENIDIEFGQITALAAGAAVISSADIDGASKAAIGGAFMTDVMTDGSTGQMRSLQGSYDAELERSRAKANASASTPAPAASTTPPASSGAATKGAPTKQPPDGTGNAQTQPKTTTQISTPPSPKVDFACTFYSKKQCDEYIMDDKGQIDDMKTLCFQSFGNVEASCRQEAPSCSYRTSWGLKIAYAYYSDNFYFKQSCIDGGGELR